jgi:hypothetical protein
MQIKFFRSAVSRPLVLVVLLGVVALGFRGHAEAAAVEAEEVKGQVAPAEGGASLNPTDAEAEAGSPLQRHARQVSSFAPYS